jgi:hypothetical protein
MTTAPGRRPAREMVLVVDFGTTFTKAALLVPGDPSPHVVPDRWPRPRSARTAAT